VDFGRSESNDIQKLLLFLIEFLELCIDLVCISRIDKVLYLHLLELAGTECEVAGRDFISKSLADLGDTKRESGMEGIYNIFEVHKHTLGCFRAQV
jgi:hypothetical protein